MVVDYGLISELYIIFIMASSHIDQSQWPKMVAFEAEFNAKILVIFCNYINTSLYY